MAKEVGVAETEVVTSIRRLVEVDKVREANALLDDGWTLLSAQQDPYGRPWYVLGSDNPDADADRVLAACKRAADEPF
jgi:hypothetical protein